MSFQEGTESLATLTTRQVAELLHLSPTTLKRLVARGELPAPHLLTQRRPRWRQCDLARWLADRPRVACPGSRTP